jgi:3D-(3,5/4)-trihydroxycyclohexane-1,2-dione acylhydrolase (decyclizing)
VSGSTLRLTVGQAVVRFLAAQRSERDGHISKLIEGCFGIFGHGNVAGIGQALLQAAESDPSLLPYHQARNEQGMVHAAVGFARMRNRLSTFACTSSIGPGATNMVTGAALATVNRLPVLLLPGDVFATRVANPVLQELEDPRSLDVSVNDAFRPVSRYFDRVWRPEQLPSALLNAMRVLTDPAETGAVTVCLPQDVGAEAWDFPAELFDERVWHIARPQPDPAAIDRAAALLAAAQAPLIVAGGGVTYSDATKALAAFAEATGIPVAETHAGKGSLPWDHPQSAGAVGATGNHAANALAADADVVIGIGTRWSDFTTASRTVFARDDVRFVNVNISAFDAAKHAGEMVTCDARAGISALTSALAGYRVPSDRQQRLRDLQVAWQQTVDDAYAGRLTEPGRSNALDPGEAPPLEGARSLASQVEVIGVVNDVVADADIVLNAAGSMPGDLHKLWRSRDPQAYHVEYGFSCMGYEIAAGLGVALAAPERNVVVLVGDGSYLMLATELVTAVAERLHLTVVLVQNHGYASIGALSGSVGADRFGTAYRYRNPVTGRHDGDVLPVDLAANAESLGARVVRAADLTEFRLALQDALAGDDVCVIEIKTDPLRPGPDSLAWWDVPVAQVSELSATKAARASYEDDRKAQRPLIRPSGSTSWVQTNEEPT